MSTVIDDLALRVAPFSLGSRPVSKTDPKSKALITKKVKAGPLAAYRVPARAGASNVVALIPAAFKAMALVRFSSPTSWGIMACRAGIKKDMQAPRTMETHQQVHPGHRACGNGYSDGQGT